MSYDNAFIEMVRSFGILGYPAHEIVFLVDPTDPVQFEKDFADPEHEIYKSYHKGKMTGVYTLDKALFDQAKNNNIDANDKLHQRQRTRNIDTAIHQRFDL